MRPFTGTALAILLLVFAGAPAGAQPKDEKVDEKKLIGKWEPTDAPEGVKVVIEFAAKGKLSIAVDVGGKSERVDGTYKLAGDKLTLMMKSGEKEQTKTVSVTKLTDTDLVVKEEKGKEETLKRLIEKKKKK